MLLGRIKPTLIAAQSVDQAGFIPGFSTDDHLFTVSLLQAKAAEWRENVWVAAVDYSKAFDTVEHASLWRALQKKGIPDQYIKV